MEKVVLNVLKGRMENLEKGFEIGTSYGKEIMEYSILKYIHEYFSDCDEISQYWNYITEYYGDEEVDESFTSNPNTACSDLVQISHIQEIVDMIIKDMNDADISRVHLNNKLFEVGELRIKQELVWENIVKHDEKKFRRFIRIFFNLYIK